MADYGDLPTCRDLVRLSLRAVEELGVSAKSHEITDQIIDDLDVDDETLGIMYENRPETAVVIDRVDWARSSSDPGGPLARLRQEVEVGRSGPERGGTRTRNPGRCRPLSPRRT